MFTTIIDYLHILIELNMNYFAVIKPLDFRNSQIELEMKRVIRVTERRSEQRRQSRSSASEQDRRLLMFTLPREPVRYIDFGDGRLARLVVSVRSMIVVIKLLQRYFLS